MAHAAQALADLTEISTQVQAAVVFDREGTVLASTLDDERAGRLTSTALELVRAAQDRADAGAEGVRELAQLDITLRDGSVFVVADHDRLIAATTTPEPTVGLVYYDLKNCLRALSEQAEPEPAGAKPKRAAASRSRAKKDDEAA
jgi:predicted regulator of Ras-like GTPase activity (Roadblock/LC7/MglB family)